MNENNFWEMMDRISDILQIANYEMLLKDASNNDLMKELQNQDIILAEQTEKYLKTIVAQNNEIINLLKGGKNGN